MWNASGMRYALGLAFVAAIAMLGEGIFAQGGADPNAAPNPYRVDEGWAKLPQGRKWGAAIGVDIDRGAAAAGRVANQGRQRIERSEVVQGDKCQRPGRLEARNRPNKSARLLNEPRCDPRAAMSMNLTQEGGAHMVLAQKQS